MKRRRKIGLLGGSFNPAHEGHRDISLAALAYFGLDEVWWLVAPQNPLKSTDGMAPLATRIASAQAKAAHPRIRVTDIEIRLGTRFTADTLAKLVDLYRDCRFLWLMGADNLVQIDHWKNWQQIFHLLPIAVFDRPTYTYRALAAKAARRFAKFRLRESASLELIETSAPAWMFMHHRLNPISATAIRAEAAQAEARRAAARRH
ncbi:nicotinate-nucleotide adenylyltransferase [Dongia soli]|uniref:Probable nicotinate-nucleotide adenylyltransferase n=1 Tax=Dongia soli TaxID=600628 RepID=A0ABU5EDS6_9PROT|nr:nicotinate-nucleotide adenylyltransferase [Dongia soli]MDY0884307.1 nicotinate-nucleotide adenylyltransferase [Dongia soli]